MQYEEIEPSPDLQPFVKCFWQLEGQQDLTHVERIVPDGRMELIIEFGDLFERLDAGPSVQQRSTIAGQIFKPIFLRPTGKTTGMFAVRFRPQGFTAIFEVKAEEFREKFVLSEDVFGKVACEIEEKICTATSSQERVRIMENFLRSHLQKSRTFDKYTRTAADLFSHSPDENHILKLTREFGIGLRQFERQFKGQVGMSASQFIKISRFQRVISTKLARPEMSFSELAVENGYYDQSHFSREFKDLSGLSPKAFFAESHTLNDFFTE